MSSQDNPQQKPGGNFRPLYYCAECNTGFELLLERCPVCRHRKKKAKKAARHGRSPNRNRPKIRHGKRYRIFSRDLWECLRCGSTEKLTIDHIVPFGKGGTSDEENLQTLCATCNQQKGSNVADYRNPDAILDNQEVA